MQREKPSYHHKDLKNALIEKGIELVTTDGIHNFSLRKVAAICGVSHAAPYSHFQSKEELLDAMQQYITKQFVEILEITIKEHEHDPELLAYMGLAYATFFIRNPQYFSFLYSQSNLTIDLSLSRDGQSNYRPFEIYKDIVLSLLERTNYPKEKQKDAVVAIWSFIHGITSLATMKNIHYDENWEQKIVDFLAVFQNSFLNYRR